MSRKRLFPRLIEKRLLTKYVKSTILKFGGIINLKIKGKKVEYNLQDILNEQLKSLIFRFVVIRWVFVRYLSSFRKNAKEQIIRFENLHTISSKDKNTIRQAVVQSIGRIASYEAWTSALNELYDKMFTVAGGISVLFVWIVPFWVLGYEGGYDGILAVITLSVIIWMLFGLYIFWLEKTAYTFVFWMLSLSITLAVIVFITTQPNIAWLPTTIHRGIVGGLSGGSAYVGILLTTDIVTRLIRRFKWQTKFRRHSEEEIIQTLNICLHEVESGSDSWRSDDFHKTQGKVIDYLEQIAKRIENDLYSGTCCRDSDTEQWLQSSSYKIAAYIRQLKQTLLLPKKDAYDHLKKKLAYILVNAAKGNWGIIYDNIEDDKLPARKPTRRKILGTLRTLLSFAVPIIIIVIIMLIPQENLSEPIKATIITGTIGWIIMNVVTWLDPKFAQTVGSSKTIADWLSRKK